MKSFNTWHARVVLLILISVISFPTFAGKDTNKKQWREAENHIVNDEFNKALNIYIDLFKSDQQNYHFAYKVGYCFVSAENNQDVEASIDYLKMACENINPKFKNKYSERKAPILSWYYLGVAYRLNKEYDKALDCFTVYKKEMTKKETKVIDASFVDREIQSCKDSKEKFDSERMSVEKIIIKDLENPNVRCPILAFSANRLIFTNGKNNVFPPDINYGKDYSQEPFDRVFMATRSDDGMSFHSPISIEADLGISYPYIPVTSTSDGSELYLIVDKNDNGDIYMSKFEDGKYQPAKKVKGLNTRKWESHASITADGKRMYFSSMRRGGFGGLDIWYSDRDEDSKWQKPVNIGEPINTKFHEEMPYIIKNGNAIYFSSEGHLNLGGFDVFYSNFDENSKSWAKPENLGYPFSTAGNDMGYIVENTPVFAFCPVNDNKRREGIGECDCISLLDEEAPQLANISGIIELNPENKDLLMQTRVKLIDKATGKEIRNVPVDENGFYIFEGVEQGNYDIVVYTPDNEELMRRNVNVPDNGDWDISNIDMKIEIGDIVADNNPISKEPLYCENVLFDFDKSDIKPEFFSNLDAIASWMKENPTSVVKVTGHTDHYGTEQYNIDLSSRRANSVTSYLISKGALQEQIIVKFEGKSNGITIPVVNDNIRSLNRRTVFEIVKQGDPIMEVKPIIVPQEYRMK